MRFSRKVEHQPATESRVRNLIMEKSSVLSLFLSSKLRTLLLLAVAALLAHPAAAQAPHVQVLQLVDKGAARL